MAPSRPRPFTRQTAVIAPLMSFHTFLGFKFIRPQRDLVQTSLFRRGRPIIFSRAESFNAIIHRRTFNIASMHRRRARRPLSDLGRIDMSSSAREGILWSFFFILVRRPVGNGWKILSGFSFSAMDESRLRADDDLRAGFPRHTAHPAVEITCASVRAAWMLNPGSRRRNRRVLNFGNLVVLGQDDCTALFFKPFEILSALSRITSELSLRRERFPRRRAPPTVRCNSFLGFRKSDRKAPSFSEIRQRAARWA
jgi:hypothetical protein